MEKIIEIPENEAPPTLEQQLRGALYAGANYHQVTKIVCGYRVAYIVSEYLWNQRVDLAKVDPGDPSPPTE